ncbi:6858_t:CDS:2 [Acaulospora colombiana]|uniref:6858_t:CDS:1 n=1 Tax=Acaulospora colombiana TaxID=27376 RepID=A0ACA9KT86_9GLOM|nr:6858_t:CDS:2 [Acaulospora colombiana]
MGIDHPSYGDVGGTLAFAKFENSSRCTVQQLPEHLAILVIPLYEALSFGCESYADVLSRYDSIDISNSPDESIFYSGGYSHGKPTTITAVTVSEVKSGELVTLAQTSVLVTTASNGSLITSTQVSVGVITASSNFLITSTYTSVQTPSDNAAATITGADNTQNRNVPTPNTQGTQTSPPQQTTPIAQPGNTVINVQPSNVIQQVSNVVSQATNGVLQQVSNVVNHVTPVVAPVTSAVGQIVTQVASQVAQVPSDVGQVASQVTSGVGQVASQVVQIVSSASSVVPLVLPTLLKRDPPSNNDTNIPKVIIFSSSNNGVPGLNELYNGNRKALDQSIPGLALLSYQDEKSLREEESNETAKIGVEVIACSLSTASRIASEYLSFLNPTISNFWTHQTLQNASIIINCLVIILILQDETIGRHLPTSDMPVKIDSSVVETSTVSANNLTNDDLPEQHRNSIMQPNKEIEESEDDRSSIRIISSYYGNNSIRSVGSNDSTTLATRPSDFLSTRPINIGGVSKNFMHERRDSEYSRASMFKGFDDDDSKSKPIIMDEEEENVGGEPSTLNVLEPVHLED